MPQISRRSVVTMLALEPGSGEELLQPRSLRKKAFG